MPHEQKYLFMSTFAYKTRLYHFRQSICFSVIKTNEGYTFNHNSFSIQSNATDFKEAAKNVYISFDSLWRRIAEKNDTELEDINKSIKQVLHSMVDVQRSIL